MLKKIISKCLIAIMTLTMLFSTGCKKEDPRMSDPLDFEANEAMRFGNKSVDMGTFLLLATDLVPYFESQFGKDCWKQEMINLEWAEADPQAAFVLYAADSFISILSIESYFDSSDMDIDSAVNNLISQTAHEKYENFVSAIGETTAKESGVTEATYYQYTSLMYKVSVVMDELHATYGDDDQVQAAVIGLRDAIDPDFDYYNAVNWDLVGQVNFGEYGE